MFIDVQNKFSAAQAVTADANATNVIDLGIGRNLGDGEPMAVVIDVDVAADHTTGDETYTFNVVTDDNTSLSSPTTIATLTVAAASLTAGSRQVIVIPPGSVLEQYLGFAYDVGGTTPTITCTVFLQPLSMVEKVRYYKDNSTIS